MLICRYAPRCKYFDRKSVNCMHEEETRGWHITNCGKYREFEKEKKG